MKGSERTLVGVMSSSHGRLLPLLVQAKLSEVKEAHPELSVSVRFVHLYPARETAVYGAAPHLFANYLQD